jgi:hypothetical protein
MAHQQDMIGHRCMVARLRREGAYRASSTEHQTILITPPLDIKFRGDFARTGRNQPI